MSVSFHLSELGWRHERTREPLGTGRVSEYVRFRSAHHLPNGSRVRSPYLPDSLNHCLLRKVRFSVGFLQRAPIPFQNTCKSRINSY